MAQFDRPIPGQSLTAPPKGAAYERPPQTSDPEEALKIHLQNLNDPDAVEDIVHFVQQGVDIKTLNEGLLRSAVAEGLHSIDISIIIAPVLHEAIKGLVEAAGIEYDEGIDNRKEKDIIKKSRISAEAQKIMREVQKDIASGNVNYDIPTEETEVTQLEEPVVAEEPLPKEQGLMERVV